MTIDATRQYGQRMERVLRTIDADLGGDLGIARLAGVAAFSRFHFHRQFSAYFEIGVHEYVQLRRLRQAAYRLAFRQRDTVTQIALECGYGGPDAFGRAFRQRFGQTPRAFRRTPDWQCWHAALRSLSRAERMRMGRNFQDSDVRIVDLADIPVALLVHRGDPALIGQSIGRFIAWRRSVGLPPRKSATYNIWYDDPEGTPAAAFRLGLAAATEDPVAPNPDGIVAATIPGGRCAMLRCVGSDQAVRDATRFLYATWLPVSGETVRDDPPFCRRVTLFPDVAEQDAITDIVLPLRPAQDRSF